ncbi:MAG: radical SAM protein [Thermodesulfobacteriota bacterium]|nr:radical SAM protein [Thermodesulfobacteriota bacterium]
MRAPTIDIVNFCNFSCRHCLVEKSAKPEYIDKDLFSHLMRELRYLGFKYAGITGSGEISLHPQLEDIFLSLAENNIDFEILTNGYLFKEKIFPLIRNPLIRKRVQLIGFSLDSAREDIHDGNRKEGSFRRVVEAIGLCRLLGIPFYIKTAVTNLNKNELRDILLFTSGLGAVSQSFIFIQPTKRLIEEELIPDPDEIYQLFTQLTDWRRIYPRLKLEAFNTANDLFACNAFYKFGIDEEGNYLFCNNLSNVGTSAENYKGKECIGSIKEISLEDLIVRHLNYLPEVLKWRFERKDAIKKAPLSLCNWCFYQFGKLDWLKDYPDSPWTQCLTLTSMD